MVETCPICGGELEEREVAPCFDCGSLDRERECLKKGEHRYHWYRVFDQRILLCDFCDADFGSYSPEYLGMCEGSPDSPLEPLDELQEPRMTIDGYCPECRQRLAFLKFLREARAFNAR